MDIPQELLGIVEPFILAEIDFKNVHPLFNRSSGSPGNVLIIQIPKLESHTFLQCAQIVYWAATKEAPFAQLGALLSSLTESDSAWQPRIISRMGSQTAVRPWRHGVDPDGLAPRCSVGSARRSPSVFRFQIHLLGSGLRWAQATLLSLRSESGFGWDKVGWKA